MSSIEDVMASVTQIAQQVDQLTGNGDVQRFQQFNNTYAQGASFTGDTMSCLSPASVGTQIAAAGLSLTTSAAWPSANRAIFVPFYLTVTRSVYAAFVNVGGTSSGNLDVGVYNDQLMRVFSTGSTGMGSTSTLQVISLSQKQLPVGKYYLALAVDNATGVVSHFGTTATPSRMLDVHRMDSAFPLPSSVTFAASDASHIPEFGIAFRSDFA